MQGDGKGWLFVPTGLIDGPLPTHYEPVESPVAYPLYKQQANPTRKEYVREDNPLNPSPSSASVAGSGTSWIRWMMPAPENVSLDAPLTGSPGTLKFSNRPGHVSSYEDP